MAARNSNKICPEKEDNSEKFSLYWLDAEVNGSDDNKKAQEQLRSINNHLKTFDDLFKCQETIQSLHEQDRVILIVSGRLGRQILPQIHQFPQLSSIYVYCMDKQSNEEWARQFPKV